MDSELLKEAIRLFKGQVVGCEKRTCEACDEQFFCSTWQESLSPMPPGWIRIAKLEC